MEALCQCGCGGKVPLAPRTHRSQGWVKGQPVRFLFNHQTKKPHLTPRELSHQQWLGRGGIAGDRKYRFKAYGLTPEKFYAMLAAQGNRCAICGTDRPGGRWNFWQIDHDHDCCDRSGSCGKCIRAILCNRCNRVLGLIHDSWFLAYSVYEYLDKFIHLKKGAPRGIAIYR